MNVHHRNGPQAPAFHEVTVIEGSARRRSWSREEKARDRVGSPGPVVGVSAATPRRQSQPAVRPGAGNSGTARSSSWRTGPPGVAYLYSEGSSQKHPIAHLGAFKGTLQVDTFAGFDRLAAERKDNDVALAHFWAHTRRKFHDGHQATSSPIAAEALRRIAELYAVEAEIRDRPADRRRRKRAEKSRPILEAFKPWLEAQLARISDKSPRAPPSATRSASGTA